MKKLFNIIPFLGLVTLLFTSCGSDLNDNNANGKAQVGFYLTDAPIVKGYKAVNIDVKSISFSTDSTNWVNLPIGGKVVEITKFANGKDSLLSNIVLDAGVKVTQIRLLLGINNTIVLNDGTVKPLIVPNWIYFRIEIKCTVCTFTDKRI